MRVNVSATQICGPADIWSVDIWNKDIGNASIFITAHSDLVTLDCLETTVGFLFLGMLISEVQIFRIQPVGIQLFKRRSLWVNT